MTPYSMTAVLMASMLLEVGLRDVPGDVARVVVVEAGSLRSGGVSYDWPSTSRTAPSPRAR